MIGVKSLQDPASSSERDLAIIALHERHRFNNEVVFGALCRLIKNGFDVTGTDNFGVRGAIQCCRDIHLRDLIFHNYVMYTIGFCDSARDLEYVHCGKNNSVMNSHDINE